MSSRYGLTETVAILCSIAAAAFFLKAATPCQPTPLTEFICFNDETHYLVDGSAVLVRDEEGRTEDCE
jgi:hypothetical protein